MSTLLLIVAIMGPPVGSVALFLVLHYRGVRAAYGTGWIAGMKEAARTVRDHGDRMVELAPEGSLNEGLVRAQTAHRIELELLGRLS